MLIFPDWGNVSSLERVHDYCSINGEMLDNKNGTCKQKTKPVQEKTLETSKNEKNGAIETFS